MEKLVPSVVPILEGPVAKTRATGPIRSVYVRDPDLDLVDQYRFDREVADLTAYRRADIDRRAVVDVPS